MNVSDWEFRDPLFLVLAILAPVVYWLATRTASTIRFSSIRLWAGVPQTLRGRLAKLPPVLLAAAVPLLAVAAAGPRTPDAKTKVSGEGISIMMVVDRSGSMQARDLVPDDLSVDRLAVVKQVFRRFVLGGERAGGGRPDDRIGLVAFARFADSLCPLTLDHGNLVALAEELQIVTRRDEDGTALGDGLALAVERLRQERTASRIAILLTDGVTNAGAVEPLQAAQLAVAEQVKVYCIGAGSQGIAPVPAADPFTGKVGFVQQFVEIDEETLRAIADKTGGKYFRATDEANLADIYREIDRLERTKINEFRYLQYHEHYRPFVLGALGLLVVAAISSFTYFRRIP
jgi:Ca-activated chloride channel family protein